VFIIITNLLYHHSQATVNKNTYLQIAFCKREILFVFFIISLHEINKSKVFMFTDISFKEITSAFIVLFAVIDIIGSIPIIINLKESGRKINCIRATWLSAALMVGFFFGGNILLALFHVDIQSFAIAGAIIIFLLALEMILDIEIFKNQGPIKEATLVPLVFPLLAGAGAFTTLLSLRAEFAAVNILIALALNMVWVYVVLKSTNKVERFLGKGGIYILRKFFGIILLAISVKLFTSNLKWLLDSLGQ